MIDIETMDLGPEAAVVAIGARMFTVDGPGKGFECFISPELAAHMGTVGQDTMEWWRKQEQFDAVFGGKLDPADAVFRLLKFIEQYKPQVVWANSPEFDIVIMRHLCKQTGMRWPFTYKQNADFRTLVRVGAAMGVDTEALWKNPDRKAHNALDDATKQAEIAAVILKALSNRAADSDPGSVPDPSARVLRIPHPAGMQSSSPQSPEPQGSSD
jgi:hypothetical protein